MKWFRLRVIKERSDKRSWNSPWTEKEWWLVTFRLWRCFIKALVVNFVHSFSILLSQPERSPGCTKVSPHQPISIKFSQWAWRKPSWEETKADKKGWLWDRSIDKGSLPLTQLIVAFTIFEQEHTILRDICQVPVFKNSRENFSESENLLFSERCFFGE